MKGRQIKYLWIARSRTGAYVSFKQWAGVQSNPEVRKACQAWLRRKRRPDPNRKRKGPRVQPAKPACEMKSPASRKKTPASEGDKKKAK